jgi:hypothetical protein
VKAENEAGRETIGADVADATCDLGRVNGAVVDVRVVKVNLNGAKGELIIEGWEDEVESASACDSPSPEAWLEGRAADFGPAPEDMDERGEAIFLVAENGASLCGVDAVIGAVGEEAAFRLEAEIAVEVCSSTGNSAGIDRAIDEGSDAAVVRIEVAVTAVEVEAREFRSLDGGGLDGLGDCRKGGAIMQATAKAMKSAALALRNRPDRAVRFKIRWSARWRCISVDPLTAVFPDLQRPLHWVRSLRMRRSECFVYWPTDRKTEAVCASAERLGLVPIMTMV